ncbi:hypothetical protein SRHO_G00281970 [Serrasalmus rhombeus]
MRLSLESESMAHLVRVLSCSQLSPGESGTPAQTSTAFQQPCFSLSIIVILCNNPEPPCVNMQDSPKQTCLFISSQNLKYKNERREKRSQHSTAFQSSPVHTPADEHSFSLSSSEMERWTKTADGLTCSPT